LFDLLARGEWLPDDLVATMKQMTGFRNVLVHGYQTVDVAIVRDILEHRLGDLLDFVQAIRGRL
jgi:uncharacterized protein YutE (UPF0331/DUF86 family)